MPGITIRGARLHNLKNVSLTIPRDKLVVFTGLSGSGKSTMAFDTLHRESLRQYMESLGMVTYENRPPVDSITGLSPTISVDQRNTNRSPRSTVGTATDVYTYLRILYARAGHRPCPNCGADIPPVHASEDLDQSGWDPDAAEDDEEAPVACPKCRTQVPGMGMAFFSFNKPIGACPACTGTGTVFTAHIPSILDEARSLEQGAVLFWEGAYLKYGLDVLRAAARHYDIPFDPTAPVRSLPAAFRDLLLYGVESPAFLKHVHGKQTPTTVSKGRFEGVVTTLLRRYTAHAADAEGAHRERLEQMMVVQTCPACEGTRLRPEARSVTVTGLNIVEVSRLPLEKLDKWLISLHKKLPAADRAIAGQIVVNLHERIRRLTEVGLGYLTLERAAPSLSAGEAQRLRLSALLGSGLTGVLYVLDEPTIGLHTRDNPRLLRMLRLLRDLGNTILLIEHDMDLIAEADWVVDFGPGAGRLGGEVVAQGTPKRVAASRHSITGRYLSGAESIPVPAQRRPIGKQGLTIRGAREHNLKDITAFFPQRAFTAVTGVSGSGKSTLMFEILDRAARRHYYGASEAPGAHAGIEGWEHFDRIITIDQAPLSRSTRSNAATYTDAFTSIREVFASRPEARARGLTARHFSFNLPGGRCERCEGAGTLHVEMHFLPDASVRCPVCRGRRFKREVLEVKYNGLDISQVLDLTIDDALSHFVEVPAARARLSLMAGTGMGYLQLGQPASTFSGGEAQRVKLARELSRRATGSTLHLLDEPTTGLHPADIAHLLTLLQGLVDAGNTVIVIEHNLDVIKSADWVVDLGPEGGEAGGRIVARGTPEAIAASRASITGQMLKSRL